MDVTIILPIRNEAPFIERCLLSVINQDYNHEKIEILIIDGMSEDNSREIINCISVRHPGFQLRILDNPKKIVPIGLNIALRQAKGEIIIRVDGHCIIAPNYISKCVEHIQLDGVDGVGGPMKTIGETPMANAIAVGMSSLFGVGNSAFRTISGKSKLVDTIPFPAYTHQLIKRVGLYDEELVRNQDDEYNYRIRDMGGKILLAADICSTYFGRGTLRGLWRQYYRYGFWKVRVMQKHPKQMSMRQFIPSIFLLGIMFSLVLALSFVFTNSSFGLFFSTILPLSYLLVNLLSTLFAALRHGLLQVLPLPIVFAILHFSYGTGFLVGLVKFWNRWNDKIGKVPGL